MNAHYSPEFLSARRDDLTAQKDQIISELASISRFDDESGAYIAIQPEYDAGTTEDQADNSAESEVFQQREARVSDLVESLEEVEQALAKMDTDTYGRCEVTGDWISEDRLVAYPAARTCSEDHAV